MADYFVALSGNDQQTAGTISAPFKTLEKAVTVANDGDTIWCRAGSWRNFYSNLSLSSAKKLTVKAYDGNRTAAFPHPVGSYSNMTWDGIEFQSPVDNFAIRTGSNNTFTGCAFINEGAWSTNFIYFMPRAYTGTSVSGNRFIGCHIETWENVEEGIGCDSFFHHPVFTVASRSGTTLTLTLVRDEDSRITHSLKAGCHLVMANGLAMGRYYRILSADGTTVTVSVDDCELTGVMVGDTCFAGPVFTNYEFRNCTVIHDGATAAISCYRNCYGFTVDSCSVSTTSLSGSIYTNNPRCGIALWGYNEESDGTYNGGVTGLYYGFGSHHTVTNNTVTGPFLAGIYVGARHYKLEGVGVGYGGLGTEYHMTDGMPTDCTITGNTVTGSPLRVTNVKYAAMSANSPTPTTTTWTWTTDAPSDGWTAGSYPAGSASATGLYEEPVDPAPEPYLPTYDFDVLLLADQDEPDPVPEFDFDVVLLADPVELPEYDFDIVLALDRIGRPRRRLAVIDPFTPTRL